MQPDEERSEGPERRTALNRLRTSLCFSEADGEPSRVRDCVVLADKLGFDRVWVADHIMPWIHSTNQSPFAWSLLASCLERTKSITVGTMVTTPLGGRYHPAVIAQASATLDNLYPGRFELGVGTGEAVNEARFMERWSPWKERMDRLVEGVDLIRKLWRSASYFDHSGRYFSMDRAYLYTKPKADLDVYFSAMGPRSAYLAGRYGDHLITLLMNASGIDISTEALRTLIFPRFESGARAAGKDTSCMEKVIAFGFTFQDERSYLKMMRDYAGVYARGAVDEPDPRTIESMKSSVTDEEILRNVLFCKGWPDAIDFISRLRAMGAKRGQPLGRGRRGDDT